MNPAADGVDAPGEHECVTQVFDRESGLRAIIAIHSTRLGPAAGGCRLYPYASPGDALRDVLRLSAAMTWKNALAGLPLGGGKSVIIAPPGEKTPALLAAFARAVNQLSGRYYTAEDVGIGAEDVERLAQDTPYVFGRLIGGQRTGDPSPFTARGVYRGLQAAVQHRLGRHDVAGLTVAVQGVGNVGFELCRALHADGARILVADPDPSAVIRACDSFKATPVDIDRIALVEADIFAPCALGGTVDARFAENGSARIVAGAANNQLAGAEVSALLAARDITYVPDFVANAGGMLNAACDILGAYDRTAVLARIDRIRERVLEILDRSRATGISSQAVAEQMARDVVAAGSQR